LQHGDVRLRISVPSFNVLRPEDLLALKFRFEGMALLGSDGEAPGLAIAQPGQQARLSVTFPPQHLVEHSYYSPDPTLLIPGDSPETETPDPNQPIAVRLGEESRLAFTVPSDAEPISLDLQSLLSWSKLVQDIVKPASYLPNQQPAPGEQVGPQQPLSETSIELPYRLALSPNASAGWSHRDTPVTHGEWTELWHTRLGIRKPIDGAPGEFFADERDTDENLKLRAVRAVSSPDWPTPAGEPFPNRIGPPARGSALTSHDRHDIVANSSDFRQRGFLPQPAFVKRLMLSGLGGWLDARALWGDNPNHISLQEWRHIAAQGRDQYVRVVRRGHLFPFGHRASWVIISERRFFGDLGGDPALNSAYVFERDFIVVTQPVCRYANLSNSTNKGRDLPFTEIEITTLTTPTLDSPVNHLIFPIIPIPHRPASRFRGPIINAGGKSEDRARRDDMNAGQPIVFWIYQQSGTPFLFHMRGRDQDTSSDRRGRPIDFSAAAIFVDAEAGKSDIDAAKQAYNTNPEHLAEANMGGQKIALAKPAKVGDTTYEVERFTFKTGDSPDPPSSPGDPTSNSFPIYPSVAQATVHLPAVRQLTKPPSAADQAVAIAYYPPYLTDQANEDFANNVGEVFAQLASPLAIGFSGDRASGISSPDMQITGLSRRFGTVAGEISMLAQAAPTFEPKAFFQGANPTLLGGITLTEIIKKGVPVLARVPKAGSQNAAEDSVPVLKIDSSVPDKIIAQLSWNPATVDSFALSGLEITFIDKRLSLNSEVVTPLNPDDPVKAVTAVTTGELNNFNLNFLGFVIVAFDRLKFTAEKGQKPQVNLDFAPEPVTLGPKLDFLQPLMDALKRLPLGPSNAIAAAGAGSGLSIDIEGNVVKAGYTLAIPAIGIGVFSLENIRFGIGLSIPLSNDPVALGFHVAEKDHHFNLTIALLGGGGFFAIEVNAKGIQRLEFAIEAAASLSLNLGVASGSAHVAIGVYFFFEDQNTLITGYLRAGGELTILQVVSLHVELYLGLTYASIDGQQIIWGEASLTVEVVVAFLHKSVTLTMRREFLVGGQRLPTPRPTAAGLIRKPVRPLDAPGAGEFSIALMLEPQDWKDYALAFA
jgi:hypothetical protein